MLTFHRRKCTVVCFPLVLVVLLATSCAPATPTPGVPTPPATPTVPPPAPPTTEVAATPVPTKTPTATPTPEVVGIRTMSVDEVPRISVEELKELMDGGADIVILDSQPKSVYEQGHIKGAISFPWAMEIDEEDTWMLLWAQPIVSYCRCGPGEADSADVARQLLGMGFSDVKVLGHPSIDGWIEAGYPTE